jgi:hypothetical protein
MFMKWRHGRVIRGTLAFLAIAWLLPAVAVRDDGPEVPFPLDEQVIFPWESVQGTWDVKSDRPATRYSLEVRSESGGQKALRILEVDLSTCALSAVGSGFSLSPKAVRGVMLQQIVFNEQRAYIVIIRAFQHGKQLEMVLTKRSLSDPERDVSHFMLSKQSDLPLRADGANRCEIAK